MHAFLNQLPTFGLILIVAVSAARAERIQDVGRVVTIAHEVSDSAFSQTVTGAPRGRTVDLLPVPATDEGGVGWTAFCEDSQIDPNRIWQMRDGVLVLKAGPRGYIRTEKDFANFRLILQWRRPPDEESGRAGVLIRMTGPDKIWPKSLEAQLNAGEAGDFWGLDGYRLDGPPKRVTRVRHDQFGTLTNLKKTTDAEKAAGEWNRYEIIADGPTVTLKINGQQVNQATNCEVVPGKICLTAEGDEIQFRNLRLTPLR